MPILILYSVSLCHCGRKGTMERICTVYTVCVCLYIYIYIYIYILYAVEMQDIVLVQSIRIGL